MMTLQNTEGYTQEQLDALNAEFAERWESGYYDWIGTDDEAMDQAEKGFSDEVARRRAGAILGSVKSPRKAEASRANGAKGGRPKGIGVPMPFGDGQYRLSWVTDWQPENITDLGEGDVVVERHGKLYCLLTIAEARAAINRANADHKSDKAAWNATVKSMVRDRHISRAEAIDIIGPAPEWALTI